MSTVSLPRFSPNEHFSLTDQQADSKATNSPKTSIKQTKLVKSKIPKGKYFGVDQQPAQQHRPSQRDKILLWYTYNIQFVS